MSTSNNNKKEDKMTKLAIIGTAGRKDDAARMNKAKYIAMVKYAEEYVSNKKNVHLVSGGAAWADHVAVSLFLMGKAKSLTLYLPYSMDDIINEKGTGKTVSYYHKQFSMKLTNNPQHTINTLVSLSNNNDCIINTSCKGFHSRNLLVGEVDEVLAFTFNKGNTPKDGGTLHTWKNSCAKIKKHVNLFEL